MRKYSFITFAALVAGCGGGGDDCCTSQQQAQVSFDGQHVQVCIHPRGQKQTCHIPTLPPDIGPIVAVIPAHFKNRIVALNFVSNGRAYLCDFDPAFFPAVCLPVDAPPPLGAVLAPNAPPLVYQPDSAISRAFEAELAFNTGFPH